MGAIIYNSAKNGAYVKSIVSSYSNTWSKQTSSPKTEVSGHVAEAGYSKGNTSASVKVMGASASVGVKTGGEAYLAKYEASTTIKIPFTNKKITISGEASIGFSAGVEFDVKRARFGVKYGNGVGLGVTFDISK